MVEITREELVTFLQAKLAAYIHATPAEVSPDEEFSNLGLDSINALLLIDDIERRIGKQVNPLWFWECPTIRLFAEKLLSENHESRTLAS